MGKWDTEIGKKPHNNQEKKKGKEKKAFRRSVTQTLGITQIRAEKAQFGCYFKSRSLPKRVQFGAMIEMDDAEAENHMV